MKDKTMDNVYNILNHFNISSITNIETITKGRTSNAWKIETTEEKYVLRSLKDKNQGEFEYLISNHVNKNHRGIVPLIIPTLSGHNYIKYDDLYFNLQLFILGDSFKNNDICSFSGLGKSIGILHKVLSNLSIKELQEDRFDMIICWEKIKSKWKRLHQLSSSLFINYDQMNKNIMRLYEITSEKKQIIHADLGIWNLLSVGNNVVIIDFGEARLGHNLFDVAGAISSCINTIESEEVIVCKIRDFIIEYEKHMGKMDLIALNNYIQLWLLRGLLTLIHMSDIDNLNINICRKYIYDIGFYEKLINKNYI